MKTSATAATPLPSLGSRVSIAFEKAWFDGTVKAHRTSLSFRSAVEEFQVLFDDGQVRTDTSRDTLTPARIP